ncbi:transposon Ty3-G Gag-Pol polyprotein [Elysia marginata]|uniref:Transposon Ty3-G Gag-Pol polyprotein n=1 Tax=Elysia marginata TaxID=1093978 RepID=A0AAV4JJ36_9GAST|nr:transposon Ty3-G Gag-Pol polyprotein [Elysia marginata]
MLKKCEQSNQDPFKALLELRNTPRQDTNKSPAEMMLGRKLKTLLPTKTLRSKHDSEYHKQRQQKRETIRNFYNRVKTHRNRKPCVLQNIARHLGPRKGDVKPK